MTLKERAANEMGKRIFMYHMFWFTSVGCVKQEKADVMDGPRSNVAKTVPHKAEKTEKSLPPQTYTSSDVGPNSNQDQLIREKKKNYMDSLPGSLPDTAEEYTLTIDISQGFASSWKENVIAVFDQTILDEKPRTVLKGVKKGKALIFQSQPSASIGYLILYGIGVPPDYGMNTPIAIYSNDSSNKQNEVYFVIGHAMGVSHFFCDMIGKPLEKSKEYNDINGFWYKLKTNVWYRLMENEPDPENTSQLVFKFKFQEKQQ